MHHLHIQDRYCILFSSEENFSVHDYYDYVLCDLSNRLDRYISWCTWWVRWMIYTRERKDKLGSLVLPILPLILSTFYYFYASDTSDFILFALQGAGLYNFGSTCFANCVLQALHAMPSLVELCQGISRHGGALHKGLSVTLADMAASTAKVKPSWIFRNLPSIMSG